MAAPRGKLVTPVGFDPSGNLLALEVDANGYLKVVAGDTSLSSLLTELQQKLETADLNIEAITKHLQVDVVAAPTTTVTQTTPANLLAGSHGYVKAAWQKNPILFGYSDLINGDYSNLALPAGNPTLNSAAVPAGSIWVITNIYLMYVGTVPSSISAYLVNGAVSVRLFRQSSPVSGAGYDRQGWWVLKEADVIQALVLGATLNDDLYLSISGFVVNINL